MSAGYASRLKDYPNKGVCGLKESTDSKRALQNKIKSLIKLFETSNRIVFLTGAGISTSAGIPDFRGPKGIWTKENERSKNGKKRKLESINSPYVDSSTADTSSSSSAPPPSTELLESSYQPTLTHRAIAKLIDLNMAQYCITQNVDGLHRRSGIPRDNLSVLHGCLFTEKCEKCHAEYFRNYDLGGVGLQKTGRKCETDSCNGDLRDTVLDWDDELPEKDYELAIEECVKSDLVISLGTSLRIQPAADLPSRGKRFVIVNLQVTPYDPKAELIIRAKVDDVMSGLLEGINVTLDD